MLIREFRIIMPMTPEEYQVAQLYSVAEASKNETGGGEGIEVVTNEKRDFNPAELKEHRRPGAPRLQGYQYPADCQYTYKIYHIEKKVPRIVRALAPQGSLEVAEEAWNAFPYCVTVVTNPQYMKSKFVLKIETMHVANNCNLENVHNLTGEELMKREVQYIDIVNDPLHSNDDYKAEHDPTKFHSEKTGRGPLVGPNWWQKLGDTPVMCAYKLVTINFEWFGLQTAVEALIMKQERRIFLNFHRQVFCWMDKWHGMTMEDIRAIEDKTKHELDEARSKGEVKGTIAD